MKIDLKKLGLTEESTFADIQAKLNEQVVYTEEEVATERNSAAAGARAAAEAKAIAKFKKANKLSDEDAKLLKEAKFNNKAKELKKNEILAKFDDKDFNLIVKAYGLANLEGDELNTAIDTINKEESTRMSNDLPKVIKAGDKEANKTSTAIQVPGKLGIFSKQE